MASSIKLTSCIGAQLCEFPCKSHLRTIMIVTSVDVRTVTPKYRGDGEVTEKNVLSIHVR